MTDRVLIDIALALTVALIMVAMGLSLRVSDFTRLIRRPRAVVAGLFGQLILLPALAFGLAYALELANPFALGLVLLSACPGGAHSNLYSDLARADTALSITLTALSSVICLVTIPAFVALGLHAFGNQQTTLSAPATELMTRLVLTVALPLGLGMMLKARQPKLAARLEPWCKGLGIIALTIFVAGPSIARSEQLAPIVAMVWIPVLALNLSAMLGGAALARLVRLPSPQQRSLALEVGIQNAALAVQLAVMLDPNWTTAFPAIVYSLLVYVTGLMVIVSGRRAPPHSPTGDDVH